MKKISPARLVTLIANLGVIAGILLLAFELRQNNDLMEADARQARTAMVVDAWRFTAINGDLTELRERERNGEDLTGDETRRIDAAVMSVYVLVEWTFDELGADSEQMRQVREVQRHNFRQFSRIPESLGNKKVLFRS